MTRTLGDYYAAAERQFLLMQSPVRDTGLELLRIVQGLTAAILTNSHQRQRAALDEAKEVANEREFLGEEVEPFGREPNDFTELALRIVAAENRIDEVRAALAEIYKLAFQTDSGSDAQNGGDDAEANSDG